jgi:hypothetical protein
MLQNRPGLAAGNFVATGGISTVQRTVLKSV